MASKFRYRQFLVFVGAQISVLRIRWVLYVLFSSSSQGCINAGSPVGAIAMYDEILRLGLNPDRLTFNTLISACVKTDKLELAMHFFEEMKVPSIYLRGQFRAWICTLIALDNCLDQEIRNLFCSFQDKARKFHDDVFPDVVTYTTLLKVHFLAFNYSFNLLCLLPYIVN